MLALSWLTHVSYGEGGGCLSHTHFSNRKDPLWLATFWLTDFCCSASCYLTWLAALLVWVPKSCLNSGYCKQCLVYPPKVGHPLALPMKSCCSIECFASIPSFHLNLTHFSFLAWQSTKCCKPTATNKILVSISLAAPFGVPSLLSLASGREAILSIPTSLTESITPLRMLSIWFLLIALLMYTGGVLSAYSSWTRSANLADFMEMDLETPPGSLKCGHT